MGKFVWQMLEQSPKPRKKNLFCRDYLFDCVLMAVCECLCCITYTYLEKERKMHRTDPNGLMWSHLDLVLLIHLNATSPDARDDSFTLSKRKSTLLSCSFVCVLLSCLFSPFLLDIACTVSIPFRIFFLCVPENDAKEHNIHFVAMHRNSFDSFCCCSGVCMCESKIIIQEVERWTESVYFNQFRVSGSLSSPHSLIATLIISAIFSSAFVFSPVKFIRNNVIAWWSSI